MYDITFLFSIIGKWNVFKCEINQINQAFLLYKIIISYTTKNLLVFGFRKKVKRDKN